jgi:hypothetical protein
MSEWEFKMKSSLAGNSSKINGYSDPKNILSEKTETYF